MTVLTASGNPRPISWIGDRRIDLERHPDPSRVQPIRIRAGAFAPGRPSRDLYLSPDHAVFHDNRLIPIRLLVNNATILPDPHARTVHYFHVELDRHDILLAENLPAESYLDTGNRVMFANAGASLILHADFGVDPQHRRASKSCAPSPPRRSNQSGASSPTVPRNSATIYRNPRPPTIQRSILSPTIVPSRR